MKTRQRKFWMLMSGGFAALTSCQTPNSVNLASTELTVVPAAVPSSPAARPDPSKRVCDPLGNGQASAPDGGIFARMWYQSDSTVNSTGVREFIQSSTPIDADLYFSQLNVPTRAFDRGFVAQDGSTLKAPDGSTMYEWFALHFETEVALASSDHAGKYQFAILSDDGSIVEVKRQGQTSFTELLNNDGLTPSRLRCAKEPIAMDATTRLPMKVDYYQGPRYHIALMLLWRQIPDGVSDASVPNYLADPACDQAGNDLFFDSTQVPSAPQDTFVQMLNRGWKVVAPENFHLPDSAPRNPCEVGSIGVGA